MHFLIFWFFLLPLPIFSLVDLGIDNFLQTTQSQSIKSKRIGLIVNQTSITRNGVPTWKLFLDNNFHVTALFSPEHGFDGRIRAEEKVNDSRLGNIPIYSLFGTTRRPTHSMLAAVDVIIYDIQSIGSRTYTYESTLFYAMEEAAKTKIPLIVLDRPNPLGGLLVDGPMLDEELRSFVGHINIPYCHGMTIGELANYFNQEYNIHCELTVIPMKGWKRSMIFIDTGLDWVPPSPNIPDADTAFYYPTTGILGTLGLLNIGINDRNPFKVFGAPWINAKLLAEKLNAQKLPGVTFIPHHFRPNSLPYKGQDLQGIILHVNDFSNYLPVATQWIILGIIKTMYPEQFGKAFQPQREIMFKKVIGSNAVYDIIRKEKYSSWKLIELSQKERQEFLKTRKAYLIQSYQDN